MSGTFIFDCISERRRLRVVFVSDPVPTESGLTAELLQFGETAMPPDDMLFLFPCGESSKDAVQQIVESDTFGARFRESTRYINPPNLFRYVFDSQGNVTSAGQREYEWLSINRIKREGMTKVFRERGGMLTAERGYHYVSPSGKHSEYFLRVGNTMNCSGEIDFIAFCCLPLLPRSITHFYCDTGAIFPVVYAICQLRARLECETWPRIVSFESYSGLSNFRFVSPTSSIVLISASTSGRLASAVLDHEGLFTKERVKTLFYLGDSPSKEHVCDLRKDSENQSGFDPLETYSDESSCEFCKNGWTQVSIDTDHFLPGASHTKLVSIRAADSPGTWLSNFVKRVKGQGLIKAHYKDSYASYELYLDVEKLFSGEGELSNPDHEAKFEWMLDQNIPHRLKRIVHIDDESSAAMANNLKRRMGIDVVCVPIGDIVGEHTAVEDSGACVVVAAVVSTGRSLLGVSQQLRALQPNNAIQYVVGVTRCDCEESFKELRSNLVFGPKPHGFWLLDQVWLPSVAEYSTDSWDDEERYLKRILPKLPGEAVEYLQSRLATIQKAADNRERGLHDNLFIAASGDSPLKLRKGFAFLNFDYKVGDISQAETYFVVQSVLHAMRGRKGENGLSQNSFTRTVLSPRCFDRFNDGVIQAAILRAAMPAELDYSHSERISLEMRRIVELVLKNAKNEVGEAAREFALALAIGKLKLRDRDREKLYEYVQSYPVDPVVNAILLTSQRFAAL